MSYMYHTAFAPAAGIQELNWSEIDAVSGGRDRAEQRVQACVVLANVGGAILGGIAGIATTAVAGPLAGAIMGGGIGAGAAAAGSNFCTGSFAKKAKKK